MQAIRSCQAIVAFGLLVFGAPPARGQDDSYQPEQQQQQQRYDQRDQGGRRQTRPRDLLALQNDLQMLDDSLGAIQRRHPRYPEFQRRADAIGADVAALGEQLRGNGTDRRPDTGGGQAELAALRDSIALLRDDIEDARSRGPARRARVFIIPAGTEFQVILDQDLSSRSSSLEDRFFASTTTAVRANGRTVVPAGATVSGSVREVRSRHRGQADGWLRLDFSSLTPDGGAPVLLRSHVVSIDAASSTDHSARSGGLEALLGGVLGGVVGAAIDGRRGALIGAVVGVGGGLLASQGDDVYLPEGTLITLQLDRPLALARPGRSRARAALTESY